MNVGVYETCVALLKNKVFLGHYAGRRRVEEIDDFRDTIKLHSSEEELKRDIDAVLKIVNNSRQSVWVALSDASRNGDYCLLVQLDGIAFGHYWFQIKHVRMTGRELFCVVSVLRRVPDELVNPTFSFSQGFESAVRSLRNIGRGRESTVSSTERNESNAARDEANQGREPSATRGETSEENRSHAAREETNQKRQSNAPGNRNESRNDSRNHQESNPTGSATPFSFMKNLRGVTFEQITASFSNELGIGTVKPVLLFCVFTLIGAMNLMYECLLVFTKIMEVTGDITITGIHAMARLVESLSPIILGFFNLVGKVFTGLYILIAMLFGCTPYVPGQPVPMKASPPRRQAIMYR